jgi:hypothetical protein
MRNVTSLDGGQKLLESRPFHVLPRQARVTYDGYFAQVT